MGNNLLIEGLSDAVGFVGMVLVGIRGGLGLQLARGWRRSREEGGA